MGPKPPSDIPQPTSSPYHQHHQQKQSELYCPCSDCLRANYEQQIQQQHHQGGAFYKSSPIAPANRAPLPPPPQQQQKSAMQQPPPIQPKLQSSPAPQLQMSVRTGSNGSSGSVNMVAKTSSPHHAPPPAQSPIMIDQYQHHQRAHMGSSAAVHTNSNSGSPYSTASAAITAAATTAMPALHQITKHRNTSYLHHGSMGILSFSLFTIYIILLILFKTNSKTIIPLKRPHQAVKQFHRT